ncbi:hypothetical protein [Mucilaginibacter panaciglaebae]|uniref:Uncharacterized protein n=1 Tax=Mucilaginibacter panaciglaebae TaxID=502331 RepID=A0ABP7WQT4_9SPHI
MNKPISKKFKVSIIVIASICCIGYIASFNHSVKNLAYTGYYWLFKFDHFSSGDRVYASVNCMNQTQFGALALFRLMRPLTLDELKLMDQFTEPNLHIDKRHINSNGKPILVRCDKYLLKEKMKIQHSTYLGTYIKANYLAIAAIDGNHKNTTVNTIFFAIKPNPLVLANYEINNYTLPINYTWADSTLYIIPFDVSNKDIKM